MSWPQWVTPVLAVAGCALFQRGGESEADRSVYVPYRAGAPALCVSDVPGAGRAKEGRAALESGLAHLQAGDLEQAGLSLAQAGDHAAARSARAALSFLSGDAKVAKAAYRDLVAEWPGDGCLAQAAAYVYLIAGPRSYAPPLARDARRLRPHDAEVLFLDGILHAVDGDGDGAATAYRAALAEAPGHPAVSAALGALYLQQGDAVLALPLLETASAAGFDVDAMLAPAYYGAGRLPEYLRSVARQGYPLPGAATIAAADDTESAYLAALGGAPGERLVAELHTSMGTLHCELYWQDAPVAVGNFVGLARGELPWVDPLSGQPGSGPFYDGTIFHRVIPDFMVQGGDRKGTGSGGPGYAFPDEVAPRLHFDRAGVLAMANHGPDTNGSQFFVTEQPVSHLDGGYTIFGACDDASVGVVQQIARVPRADADKPVDDVVLERVEIRTEPAAD